MNTSQVLVIGSGFGGAVSAARIAEAGFHVKILERGPWRDSVPVRSMGIKDRAPLPMGRHFPTHVLRTIRNTLLPRGKLTFNKSGFYDIYVDRKITILSTSNVGGGSHAYGALNMRPPEAGYWDAAGLSDKEMERHYQSVLLRMGSSIPKPENLGNAVSELFKDSELLVSDESAIALGMGFLFPKNPGRPTEVTTVDGVARYEVQFGQDGVLGSYYGGKTTLDFAYLARAIAKHGLEVCELREALRIKPVVGSNVGRYCVTVRNHHTGEIEQYFAEHVIVAAGALNTLELLLHSRDEDDGLKGMPRWCSEPDLTG